MSVYVTDTHPLIWYATGMSASFRRLLGQLLFVPDRHDPNGFAFEAIKEAVRGDDDLSIRKVGKLGHYSPGFWEALESSKYMLGTFAQSARGGWFVARDVSEAR